MFEASIYCLCCAGFPDKPHPLVLTEGELMQESRSTLSNVASRLGCQQCGAVSNAHRRPQLEYQQNKAKCEIIQYDDDSLEGRFLAKWQLLNPLPDPMEPKRCPVVSNRQVFSVRREGDCDR